MRFIVIVLITVSLLFSGCLQSKDEWEVSPSFKSGYYTLYGNEEKFGITRYNGEELFEAYTGGHYGLFFWGTDEELKGKYKLTATHKETGESVELYEWDIQLTPGGTGADAQSGGKFSLNKKGLWRLNVSINGVHFDDIVVNVK